VLGSFGTSLNIEGIKNNMAKKTIIANWKNHPESLAQAQEILDFTNDYLDSLGDFRELSLVFCPPFVFMEEVAKILQMSHFEHEAFLGAQDIAAEDKTALTGEISGPMLKRLGVDYVIIGHSERRWKLGESDEVVNHKLKTAIENGLTPVVCIGEKVRDGGFGKFIEDQVLKTFKGLGPDQIKRCLIAYEPVWAISTNPGAKPDTPDSSLESVNIIRDVLIGNWKLEIRNLPRVLYGGSVSSKNAADFLNRKEFSGVLVGGASVNKEEFVKILEITSKIK